MLDQLNYYAHGYVVVPVTLACRAKGLFDLLMREGPLGRDQIRSRLDANSGHLDVALSMFESLGWVSRQADCYHAADCNPGPLAIPLQLGELFQFPFEDYLRGNDALTLQRWIDTSNQRWGVADERFAQLMDGVIVTPLLVALHASGRLQGSAGLRDALGPSVAARVADELRAFCQALGWVDSGIEGAWTALGSFMTDRALVLATTGSYRPMLARASELLFGDSASVFGRDEAGHERHVDRTLNVIGSGHQHRKYFQQLDDIIIEIFDNDSFANQPRHIADMGCGDGTLLAHVHDVILHSTRRGAHLDQFPLTLIGADYNHKALQATAQTLVGRDHVVIQADVAKPAQLLDDLRSLGLADVEKTLHLRSFLDHDRPHVPAVDTEAVRRLEGVPFEGVFVAEDGSSRKPAEVFQSLVEHLTRWAFVLGDHPLVTLEVHSLPPRVVQANLARCENLHFDAYHRLSRQLLVDANEFLIAAASAGLFPHRNRVRRNPKTLGFARITLTAFERRPYSVRWASSQDVESLCRLEQRSWSKELGASTSTIRQRLSRHPRGQLVLELEGQVVAAVYSQLLVDEAALAGCTADSVENKHCSDGTVVQLLGVTVDPDHQHRQLGDQLLEFMLLYCELTPEVDTAVGITRCTGYHQHADLSVTEYLRRTADDGLCMDPVVRFHQFHGATVGAPVPNFRPLDRDSHGFGVHIRYALGQRKRIAPSDSSSARSPRVSGQTFRNTLSELAVRILGKPADATQPLMELGFDSADILELRSNIEASLGIELPSSFFFEHPTLDKIAQALDAPRAHCSAARTGKSPVTARAPSLDSDHASQHIAIVGVACRLPGGLDSLEALWKFLDASGNAIDVAPRPRWTWPSSIDPQLEHRGIDRGGFLPDISVFDASLFRLSPTEVEVMDPQQRMLLELAWEAIESAGYCARTVAGRSAGVFVGASGSDYRLLLERSAAAEVAHAASGCSMASLANRVSYFYDLRGPSIQVDTACSSSLVAVHQAVQAIRTGQCSEAIVCGINIICHPTNTLAYYRAGMLSHDAQCKTFDRDADGYVRAEGAIVLVLKSLRDAVRDRDPIRAVIRGTACNHGGLSGGLTVPNPNQQAALLRAAWSDAKVSPEQLGYIEAHGTGTRLGDPIEVRGLKQAVATSEADVEGARISLGSIKSNLGHLEAAAGLAGMLKLIVALQKRRIPPTINFRQLNPEIRLQDSPFVIADTSRPWAASSPSSLRVGGVSSFGSGGTNAHVIVEEYTVKPTAQRDDEADSVDLLFSLSAKTEERLSVYAQRLLVHLQAVQHEAPSLASVVYSLQRRQPLEQRVAFVISSFAELLEGMKCIAQGTPSARQWKGNARDGGDLISFIQSQADMQGVVAQWGQSRRLEDIARLWVTGFEIDDWGILYDRPPPVVDLPGYPFERRRFWLPDERVAPAPKLAGEGASHPMQPCSVEHAVQPPRGSQHHEYRFTFSGNEFFLSDHHVRRQPVLPAVVYLEMVRAALRPHGGTENSTLEQVSWRRPLVVDRSKSVRVVIETDSSRTRFSVIDEATQLVHCEGIVGSGGPPSAQDTPELAALMSRMPAAADESRQPSAESFYAALDSLGLNYGSAHRALRRMSHDHDKGELLAELRAPSSVDDSTFSTYQLHPSLFDAALQAGLTLVGEPTKVPTSLALPFSLGKLEVAGSTSRAMWAWVRRSSAAAKQTTLDVVLYDNDGRVCAKASALSLRELDICSCAPSFSTTLFRPVWTQREPTQLRRPRVVVGVSCGIANLKAAYEQALSTQHSRTQTFEASNATDFTQQAVQLLELVNRTLTVEPHGDVLLQVFVPLDDPLMRSGLSGMLQTASREHPSLRTQLVELAPDTSVSELATIVAEETQAWSDAHVRREHGSRLLRRFERLTSSAPVSSPWREGGRYLITGGCGHLGWLFATEIAGQVQRASIVLMGRSPLDDIQRARLEELERPGLKVTYHCVDVIQLDSVRELIAHVANDLGGLDGILHAAGATADRLMRDKTAADAERVLAPKVDGTLNVAEASRHLDLDFIVLFSSFVAITGNIGQADYATANAFMDAFARQRGADRRGRILSINWPLWAQGGMGNEPRVLRQLFDDLGLAPMPSADGLELFSRALATSESQLVVGHGPAAVIEERLNAAAVVTREPETQPKAASKLFYSPHTFEAAVDDYLSRVVVRVLKTPIDALQSTTSFSDYGVDSILALDLTRELEKDLGVLSKTLFFEHENIAQLRRTLIDQRSEKLYALLNPPPSTVNDAAADAHSAAPTPAAPTPAARTPAPAPAAAEPPRRPAEAALGGPALIAKATIERTPKLKNQLQEIRGHHRPDPALYDLWPQVFIADGEVGYCHWLEDGSLVFATGCSARSEDERLATLEQLVRHCRARAQSLCYLDLSGNRDESFERVANMVSTPVGVMQTIQDIGQFSLKGGRMRRLRYLVDKFGSAGKCRATEYRQWDADIERQIIDVMLEWCEKKKFVNNVDVVLRALHERTLLDRYRVFLTYVDDALQNVILLLPIERGYLMDQEYYRSTMPLGGTEYAVVEMIKQLSDEGFDVFDLGLTWGLFDAPQGYSDERSRRFLETTRSQLGQILQRGRDNHQYKSKYRPVDRAVYFYRPHESDDSVLVACLSQFFKQGITVDEVRQRLPKTDNQDTLPAGDDRFFDPLSVDPSAVHLDLMSDSWSHLHHPAIEARSSELLRRTGGEVSIPAVVHELFGHSNVVLTQSGRLAERLFFRTFPSSRRTILQNVLFDSTLHNLVKAGFHPVELPDPRIFEAESAALFRGGVDLERLGTHLAKSRDVGLVFVELCNNASGGYPVSLSHLNSIADLCKQHAVSLALDVTRVLRNAELIRLHEPGQGHRSLWSIVNELTATADILLGSLSKDFCLPSGGILASKSEQRCQAASRYGVIDGGLLDSLQQRVVAQALLDRPYLETQVRENVQHVHSLHQALAAEQVPVVQPGGGHCVLVRVDALRDFSGRKYARESYLRMLLERHGLRGGSHLVGDQRDTRLNHCVRFALPVGLTTSTDVRRISSALGGRLDPDGAEHDDEVQPMRRPPKPSRPRRPVAIIGLSGRYPRAPDLNAFWKNLVEGHRSISEIPAERWDWRQHYDSDPTRAVQHGKAFGKWGAFLEDFAAFDPLFFRISPKEAEFIDPQERLFLQECWKALEDAGYAPSSFSDTLRHRTGVFGGLTKQGFNLLSVGQQAPFHGTSLSAMVSRVSHLLDLRGPSYAFDCHCASALVALHEACEYIARGDGDLALVGGVNLNLHPSTYAHLSKLQVLSHNDRCEAFGAQAKGYVPGEGVGAVVLKDLDQARADGDSIYALIRASAVNHGGKTNRYGVPNQQQQEAVMWAALRCGDLDPQSVNYLEVSAYGSELGDAVESAAITSVFSSDTTRGDEYRLGSVKPNVGHGESVSGMAQLTKVLLALKHRELPKTLVPEHLSPHIDLNELPFRLQQSSGPWPSLRSHGTELPRRAGITATGASGVNAHVIVEEYPTTHSGGPSPIEEEAHVFTLSAHTRERLEAYAKRWLEFVATEPAASLGAVTHTLQLGREAMPARVAWVVRDYAELSQRLTDWLRCPQLDDAAAWPPEEVAKAGESNNLEALAQAWAAGSNVTWSCRRGFTRRPRVAGLPTYPFAREHYWTQPQAPVVARAPLKTSGEPNDDVHDGSLVVAVTQRLVTLFAEVSNVPVERIEPSSPLEQYGIDSYMITVLNARLVDIFGAISRTLFFEHQTLRSLAGHLAQEHPAASRSWAGATAKPSPTIGSTSNGNGPHRVVTSMASSEPVAIVGLSGRYPKANSLTEFWANLEAGRDCVEEIPRDRWSLHDFYEPDLERAIATGKSYSKWGGFIDDFDAFDHSFFGISPREAVDMDPQERLFLQSCWTTLEDAGYTRARVAQQHAGRVGVFAGVTRSEFSLYGPSRWSTGTHPNTSFCSIANRVSYFLDLCGPSMPIDTMCSSSLVAIHEACQHLNRGECEVALAGGVNLSLHPYMYTSLSAKRMLSLDGRCKSFGAGGNGYVPGEGVGTVLLKPLSRALADRDRIHAVILGSAVNHGGRTNGYTVPNPVRQGAVIRDALARANVDPRLVSYIEAHGTGTDLGDPIEISGLQQAFRHATPDVGYCALGSVKSNIGHLEAASGIAGLTKVVLQLEHGRLVPTCHAEQLNPNIDLDRSPFTLNTHSKDWARPVIDGKEHLRTAGVSSFGAAGTNAHVVVQEIRRAEREPTRTSTAPVAITLSARKKEQLRVYAKDLLAHLERHTQAATTIDLPALAYTLHVGREDMKERMGLLVSSVEELEYKLRQFVDGNGKAAGVLTGKPASQKGMTDV